MAAAKEYYFLSTPWYKDCLTPVDGFWNIFEEIPDQKGMVRERAESTWHPMSGGLDTYLQGCSVSHCRSGLHAVGEFKHPIVIRGTYYLHA